MATAKLKRKAKRPYLDRIKNKTKLEKQKKILYRFYVFISTLLIVVTLIMIAVNPTAYLNIVVVLLLTSVVLIGIENIQMRRLSQQKPQPL